MGEGTLAPTVQSGGQASETYLFAASPPRRRVGANLSSSSRVHCCAKYRYADTGLFQAQGLVAIPECLRHFRDDDGLAR
jgi:hypothetical protein